MKNLLLITFCFCSVICFSQSYPYGKVRVVNSRADYKVRVVSNNGDLRVKQVSSFPDRTGEWQFVSSFPDFTIQFVDAHEDFTIEWDGEPYSVAETPTSHNETVYGDSEVLKHETTAYDVNPQNCTFSVKRPDGIKQYPLCAKVKLVDSNADVVVYNSTYSLHRDVFIDSTSTIPTKCCQWQFVDTDYDYTVQIVKDLSQPVDLAAHFCYLPRRYSTMPKFECGISQRWTDK